VSVPERAAALDRLADLLEADMAGLMPCASGGGEDLGPTQWRTCAKRWISCRYYAQERASGSAAHGAGPAGRESNVLTLHGRGVFACISPWNFPVAIFTGQVAAALVAGNTVVAKPAQQTPLTAYRVAELILKPGSRPAPFHLLPGDGGIGELSSPIRGSRGVAFTGSTVTPPAPFSAFSRSVEGPIAPLIAETGGLNAMSWTPPRWPEQVVDAVVASAFRSAGQRPMQLAARPVPAGGNRARGARHAAGCDGRVAHRRSRRSCDRTSARDRRAGARKAGGIHFRSRSRAS